MRVLHLTRDYPPRNCGGISSAVPALVDALAGIGVDNAVISFDSWRGRARGPASFAAAAQHGILLRIERGSPVAEISAAHDRFEPDLIHVHHENLGPFAFQLRVERNTPIVYTAHTYQWRAARSSSDQRQLLSQSDGVLAPSHALAELIRPHTAAPVEISANVVRAPTAGQRSPAPATVAYVGRFDHTKGTDLLFEVMRFGMRAHGELRFVVAGGNPANRRSERAWRRRWLETAEVGQESRVRFTGWLDAEGLEEVYRRATLQIVPSRFETFGLAAAEGMARGVPVVANRAAALAELIDDQRTGFLIDGDDPDAMARRIVELCQRSDQLAAVAAAARETIHTRFAAPVVAAATRSFYERFV